MTMAKSPSVLSRLFGRSKHPVVSSLATVALNRPLLAHPAMAESIIAGYLAGAITSADTVLAAERMQLSLPADRGAAIPSDHDDEQPKPEVAEVQQIGVINISGGLVNRPMPGASGPGPASYTAIRASFDEMMEDESVAAIVLRIESPGGMVSGCFDLTDHIFASRGSKKIYALVDDYAYSAAYAIAAACDEIWVSRSGGVGSVGACAYHEEFSAWNKNVGRKVTAVYAGEHKIDFSRDFPLKDGAKDWLQSSVDEARAAFVSSVAQYRGLSEDAVRATEAGIFEGKAGIEVGFATHLGTWHDLMASLGAGEAEAPEQPGDDGGDGADARADAVPGPDAATASQADDAARTLEVELDPEQALLLARGQALATIMESDLPAAVAMALCSSLEAGDDVAKRIEHAREVVGLCKTAKTEARAVEFVRGNNSIEQVRSALVEAKADESDKVTLQTSIPADAGKSPQVNSLDPNAIYRMRGN
jgi:signal peptide peptidase SppA